ncbi:hypothetical protein [Calothrix sp. CCY 0018]|uniref:hypothetical protein n=1 Tax=Calothrix sp. CCY 0018 TaxID=3103864 RepID=UPI0039C5B3E4
MVKQQTTQPRKILILAASPVDQAKLRLDVETREIDEGLRRSQHREQFQLEKLGAVRTDDLRRALLDINPQILHFCGHGTGSDGLVFADQQTCKWSSHTQRPKKLRYRSYASRACC